MDTTHVQRVFEQIRLHDLPHKPDDILRKGSDWTLLRLSEQSWSVMETYADDEVLLRQCYYALRMTFWSEVFMNIGVWADSDERNYTIAMGALRNGLQAIGASMINTVRQDAQRWIAEVDSAAV